MRKFFYSHVFLMLATVVSGFSFVGVSAQAALLPPTPGITVPPTILPPLPTPLPTIIPIPTPLPTIIPEPTPTLIPLPWPPFIRSGIWGRITISPVICPADIVAPWPGCPPKPYQTTIAVIRISDGKEITRFTSNKQGYFRVVLPPGKYLLESTNPTKWPHLDPVKVMVKRGVFTHVDLVFDSGIRF